MLIALTMALPCSSIDCLMAVKPLVSEASIVARLACVFLSKRVMAAGVLVYAELHIQKPCLDGGVEGCEALLQGLGLVVDGIDESVGRGLDLRRDELARAVDRRRNISPFWLMA